MPSTDISSNLSVQTQASQFSVTSSDFNHTESAWNDKFNDLNNLFELEDNWDGEGAIAPDPGIISAANALLSKIKFENRIIPPTRITASLDGTVFIDWENVDSREQLEFLSPDEAEWSFIGDNILPQHGAISLKNLSKPPQLTMTISYPHENNLFNDQNKLTDQITWTSLGVLQAA